ncbi:MAG: TetR/AcrR family transcriptional regulator [Bacillota bacterium]|nr:TetR/AcrR family transcriptional regulator [Bacillota bacterium]
MIEKKQTKRQLQAIQTKSKIYETAIELMKAKDFQDITIEEICGNAGVSVGAFYHYFSSKNDFLIEMYSRADHYFLEEVNQKLNSAQPIEKIIEFFDVYAKYNDMIGISTMKQLYHANNHLFITKGRGMQNVLEDIIADGQQKGEILQEMSPEAITEYLFIAARGVTYDWCLHDGQFSLIEQMQQYMSRLVKIFV